MSKKKEVFYNPTLSPKHCMIENVDREQGHKPFDFLSGSMPSEGHAIPYYPIKMGHSELAQSIVTRGQLALINGDLQEGLHCFEQATKLDPNNAQLYFAQGLSLFEYGDKHEIAKLLVHACKKFKMSTLLNPELFDAWQAWASALFKLGISYNEQHYFRAADEKIEQAIHLCNPQSTDILADLYWELGSINTHLARYSGEALDLHQAINAFHQAHGLQKQLPSEFWRDYGKACYQFALQINDTRFYVKGISFLKNALSSSPTSYENWALLAEIFQALYFRTYDEEHFTQANDCYEMAMKLQSDSPSLWFDWAKFLCESSHVTGDVKQLHACLEKCSHATSLDPENPAIAAIWAEALSLLGHKTEQLDLIHEAQNKISYIIETADDLPEVWHAYGVVLKAQGHYFSDFDYFYQAIEKFQEGLSIDRTRHKHWHAIGQLYTLLGELDNDLDSLERSFKFYQKAIDVRPSACYITDYAISLYKLGEMTRDQQRLEESIAQFERALSMQRNALYVRPHWLFHYACALDALGDFFEEEGYYLRAVEIFSHVLMMDPDFQTVHHRLALALSHLGELKGELDLFYRAIHHIRLCAKHDRENDVLIVDWAATLINIACHVSDASESEAFYREAEHKLWDAVQLGNPHAYYHLACLYSLLTQCGTAMQCLYKAAHYDILPSVDDMLLDEWLDNLRSTSDFIAFVSQLEQRGN